jgi:hypothetical protein
MAVELPPQHSTKTQSPPFLIPSVSLIKLGRKIFLPVIFLAIFTAHRLLVIR